MPPNPDDGGMPYIIGTLAKAQADAGHQVTVVTNSCGRQPATYSLVGAESKEAGDLLSAVPSDTDIIHLHEASNELEAGVRNTHTPSVYSIYGNHSSHRPVVHNPIYTSASHAGRHGSRQYVYNGVDTTLYHFNPTPNNQLLFIGKVRRSKKGAATAARVAKETKIPLVLAGGRKFNLVESWLPISRYVRAVGVVDGQEKLNILKHSAALLFPIQWEEPFGLVQIEAMACGTPVISFNRGAASEVIIDGKTGFIVETEAQMRDAVHAVNELNRQDCRDHVLAHFTTQKAQQAMQDHYANAIRGLNW